ncbi:MAG: hypothetical protein NZ602_08900 [Thermoguttaceae bacterium]|nr:hypothetical protein [Thermoguttaceae bacterium]MDW8037395.1 hypothetical protein [Thermoguttaceae bacterium]
MCDPVYSCAEALGRRAFLKQLSVGGAAAAAAGCTRSGIAATAESASAPEPLPTVKLGQYRISRLIVGSNPIHGYSYMGPHTDRHMKEYFTVERIVQFYRDCEQAGINTLQFSPRPDLLEALRRCRQQGCNMHRILLFSDRAQLKAMVSETQPIAVAHHGGVTDKLFGEGKKGQVHDFVKAVHDLGLLAGVSAHNPDCIKQIADEGWQVDFFMTCFYFLTRASVPGALEKIPPIQTLEFTYPFLKDDPKVMTQVIRQVRQPCLAFKILAAGRLCTNQDTVREAFRFAFANIKPADAVIVGMYPRFFDEIRANAQYTRQFGKPV